MLMLEYKLRQKIKTILEGLTPDELKNLEQKYKEEISKTQNANLEEGWNMLDLVIQKLCEVDIVQYEDLFQKYEKLEDVLKSLGFKKIGEGSFRDVWSNNSVDFVIKLEKSQYNGKIYEPSGTNKAERKKYFEFGSDFQPRNDMFPKLYAYDQIDNMWLIFEKVNTFENKKKEIITTKMFLPLFNLLRKIVKKVNKDYFFKSIKVEGKTYRIALKDDKVREFTTLSNPNMKKDALSALKVIWDLFLDRFVAETKQSGDIQYAFEKTIVFFLDQELFTIDTNFEINKDQKRKEIQSILLAKLRNYFKSELTVTPDCVWIGNIFKNELIKDMHTGNIGYRSLKNNPNEPWKNFVILDFGELGNKDLDYYHSNPISGPGSSIKNFPFKPLSFY